jgi:hypothetical protein
MIQMLRPAAAQDRAGLLRLVGREGRRFKMNARLVSVLLVLGAALVALVNAGLGSSPG